MTAKTTPKSYTMCLNPGCPDAHGDHVVAKPDKDDALCVACGEWQSDHLEEVLDFEDA
jgi:hypothetical protein